ncbi:hypothetical protein ATE92_0621 [Ulvibacter sp. MAR_2010_11]|uniref:HYC_CC_PP family protein n=1 Tax=Ulvibacter sp. MAR_2010_11 TaxID=1250229 RepID=UPI000C2C746E|nr:hypothetical protein [Ulvibacter sp. MAR_2010_11]PKA82491.1 hypothetical protein ATE92_0621 [Ulvibacter sp. MAR_2010_11]
MRKIISIFLSVLLLASSSGIAYAQHFCGEYEMLSELTLGEKNLSCGMSMDIPDCETKGTSEDHDCCDNHYTQVTTDDTFAKASFEINFTKTFVAAFVSVFVLEQPAIYTTNLISFAEYHPPPLEQDFQVLYETFLI